MKKIIGAMFLTAIILVGALTPKPAEAAPAALFAFTVLIGGWSAATYEECKTEGLSVKDCANKTYAERTDVPITQALYKKLYND